MDCAALRVKGADVSLTFINYYLGKYRLHIWDDSSNLATSNLKKNQ